MVAVIIDWQVLVNVVHVLHALSTRQLLSASCNKVVSTE
jgi:hypothetical protein